MKNVKYGIWTPWAKIMCYECHGTKFPCKEYDINSEDWKKVTTLQPLEERNAITYCDKCNCDIQVDESIAIEHNMAKKLQEQGIKAYMEQTGGMNNALCIDTIDGYYYMTHNFDGDGLYLLGRYDKDCEWLEDFCAEFETFEDTVKYISELDHIVKESK